jgi:hypothetical protein
MIEIQSRPYKPEACCEACVFGGRKHAEWCPVAQAASQNEGEKLEDLMRWALQGRNQKA